MKRIQSPIVRDNKRNTEKKKMQYFYKLNYHFLGPARDISRKVIFPAHHSNGWEQDMLQTESQAFTCPHKFRKERGKGRGEEGRKGGRLQKVIVHQILKVGRLL